MKLKTITKPLLIAILAMQLVSCDNKETLDSPFNATPTERLNAQKKELNDLLESSEFGWKAVYFTDNTQLGGYTHLFKFKEEKVDMSSDFDNDTAVYPSEYSIELGSTVSLVFTTKNKIHLLSDSNDSPTDDLKGKGYKGDFQFLYYGQDNGEIIFKTNRSFEELRFVKATAEDWSYITKNKDMIPNVIGSPTRPLYRYLETNDGTKITNYEFSFNQYTRFASTILAEVGSNETLNLGIGYTPTGIIVSPAIELANQKLSNFLYDDTDGSFTAVGNNGITAKIRYSNIPLIVTDDYKNLLLGKPEKGFGYNAAFLAKIKTTSPLCFDILNEVNEAIGISKKINRIEFAFNSPYGTYISYTFRGGKSAIYQNVTVSEDPINKTIILKHKSWESGGAIIPEPSYLKRVSEEFTNPKGLYVKKENFKVLYPNDVYSFASASSSFRITTYGY